MMRTKTLAYELWEQFGFDVPDNVVFPVGYGSNVCGCERGFAELKRRVRVLLSGDHLASVLLA